jgi:hypothetical protein
VKCANTYIQQQADFKVRAKSTELARFTQTTINTPSLYVDVFVVIRLCLSRLS